jgi:hypothetical protein
MPQEGQKGAGGERGGRRTEIVVEVITPYSDLRLAPAPPHEREGIWADLHPREDSAVRLKLDALGIWKSRWDSASLPSGGASLQPCEDSWRSSRLLLILFRTASLSPN